MNREDVYGIIAEDKSDVDMLKVIIKRLANSKAIKIRGKGYNGCGEMLRKGAAHLNSFKALGCKRFVICYDADRASPSERYDEAVLKIVNLFGNNGQCCVVVPVQEIEAWILADIKAVTFVIPSWVPKKHFDNPESINDPKEILEKLSRNSKKRPRYSHAIHNFRVAEHLDLTVVKSKCKSFSPLVRLVLNGKGNT